MIDGFRAEVKNFDRDSWLPKVNLVPEFLVNANGEEVWKVSARGNHYRHEDCKFKGYALRIVTTGHGQTLCISGSFHKSARGENHSQFDFGSLKTEVETLCRNLTLDPSTVHLQNLEVGLNLTWPTTPKVFLEKNLLAFKGEPFNQYDPDKTGISIGYYQQRQNFTQKYYDKSMQYGLTGIHILRCENRSNKMKDLKGFEVKTMQDLLDPDKVFQLKNHLLARVENLVFTDENIDPKKLPKPQAEIFKDGHSCILQKNTGMSRSSRWRFMEQFQAIVREYGTDYKSLLEDEIPTVWESLFWNKLPNLQPASERTVWNKLPNLQNGSPVEQITHFAGGSYLKDPEKLPEPFWNVLPLEYTGKTFQGIIPECTGGGEDPQMAMERVGEKKGSKTEDAAGQKKCQVTQIPLTGKARNFLTEKMVRELREKDPLTFKKLKRGFGQKMGQKPTSKKVADECYFIAHNIRNLYWNKVYQKQVRKPAGNNPLF